MNNPKIEHIQKAIEYMGEPVGCNPTLWFIGVYKRINEIALAEQQESEYITAEQARELGEDKVEWFAPYANPPTWIPCRGDAKFPRYFSGTAMEIKYRAIKQAQPEPVDPDDVRIELVVALNSLASDFEIATYSMQKGSEDRAHAEGAIAHAMKIHAKHNQNGRIFKNETKPVDPHADNFAEESHPAYRAMYAKQVAEWRVNFETTYLPAHLMQRGGVYTDRDIQHSWQGYLRARTEQATEIAQLVANLQTQRRESLELKAKLAEVMPSNDPLIVWSVSSKVGHTLFKTFENAQRYVSQFPASIGGGLHISENAVFGNIVKD
jgi:hypothetical protein